ncbi:MAG TPA: hypothetical protein PK095_15380 [Myxococcota bacterium]|nr:hypothetical protein [Myxococcota bacterium]
MSVTFQLTVEPELVVVVVSLRVMTMLLPTMGSAARAGEPSVEMRASVMALRRRIDGIDILDIRDLVAEEGRGATETAQRTEWALSGSEPDRRISDRPARG